MLFRSKGSIMKQLVLAIAAIFALSGAALAADKAPETKKVCHGKDGKQVCKTIKVHKKAEKVTEGAPTDPVKKDAKKK